VLTFLLCQTISNCVDSQVFLHEKHLIELDLSLLSALVFFEENVGILTILEVTEVFLDNFGALGLLRVFCDAD